jgi:hypothetical protein
MIKLPRKRKKAFLSYWTKKAFLKYNDMPNQERKKQAKIYAAQLYIAKTIIAEILFEEKSLAENTRYPEYSEKDIHLKRDRKPIFHW